MKCRVVESCVFKEIISLKFYKISIILMIISKVWITSKVGNRKIIFMPTVLITFVVDYAVFIFNKKQLITTKTPIAEKRK